MNGGGIPYFQIDAFACGPFTGNPAGVCLLREPLADALMQAIAAENGLSETAFVTGAGPSRAIRWFTPSVEVDLCGHATLAAAHALFAHGGESGDAVEFASASGPLVVARSGDWLWLDFPARPPRPCDVPDGLVAGLGAVPREVLRSRDVVAVFDREEDVLALAPDAAALAAVDTFGIVATAPGHACDFVSRFFAPRAGIAEDPVTGSAHCTLIPYWAERLGTTTMHAFQRSVRGGEIRCELRGSRVGIGGRAVTHLAGHLLR